VIWRTVSLGEVANVGAGNSAPQEGHLFENGIYNFYRTSDVGRIRTGVISESSDKLNSEGIKGLKLHPVGTILFPKSGASTFLNHRVMLGKEGFVSSHLATIKAKADAADDKYLLYFLSTIDAKNLIQDSSYPSLKTSVIEKIVFLLPSLPIQQKIVVKLDAIFAEIDKATAAVETKVVELKSLKNSILKQAFNG
jgi:type I restriction enzyme S subunit